VPGPVRLAFSERADGDLAIDGEPSALARRRQAFAPGEWTWLRQVHGADVVVVDAPGAGAGAPADAAVTAVPGTVLAVHTADCAPVLLVAEADGVVGAAHAGWRGIVGGVLERTVEAMGRLGAGRATAHVGPHIRARCYEFGPADLDLVAARYGDGVRAETGWGTPALDVTTAIREALDPLDVEVVDHGGCTACEPTRLWSHRARGDTARAAATVTLLDPRPEPSGRASVAPEASR
jgi:polyphenol oxidase